MGVLRAEEELCEYAFEARAKLEEFGHEGLRKGSVFTLHEKQSLDVESGGVDIGSGRRISPENYTV